MIYALNLYDLVPGQEARYAEYQRRSAALIAASVAAFDRLHALLAEHDLHRLREVSTANYIWTLFEPWQLERLSDQR